MKLFLAEKAEPADQQEPDKQGAMRMRNGEVEFQSNKAGGILGGISTGQDIIIRFAVKPTSSILISRRTVNKQGRNTSIETKGRHDPCVGIRGVPVGYSR